MVWLLPSRWDRLPYPEGILMERALSSSKMPCNVKKILNSLLDDRAIPDLL